MIPALYSTNMLSRILNVLAHENNSPKVDMPLNQTHNFDIEPTSLSGEAANNHFNVFGLNWHWIKPTTFSILVKQSNYNTREAVGNFLLAKNAIYTYWVQY